MRFMPMLRSENAAWFLGSIVVAILAATAYWLAGWIGLIISNRVDLHGGHAVIDSGHGSSAVTGYAR